MVKGLKLLTWTSSVISAVVILEIGSYIRASDSNHTAFEPWLLTVVFVPRVILGAVALLRKRALVAGIVALTLGLCGMATLTYIDRTNTMLQYERWLSRGMPLAHR
jgi:hypothetical protein